MNYAVIDNNRSNDIEFFATEAEALLFHVNRRNCYKAEYQSHIRLVRLNDLTVNHLNNLVVTGV
jgi:hypothetical protein